MLTAMRGVIGIGFCFFSQHGRAGAVAQYARFPSGGSHYLLTAAGRLAWLMYKVMRMRENGA